MNTVFSFPMRLCLSWKEIWSGQILIMARQPLLSRQHASRNQENNAINCNFASSFILTLDYPRALSLPFLLKIVIKNLARELLAWVLARQPRKERKLLAWRENLLVRDDRTGFFSSPVKAFFYHLKICLWKV